MDARFRGLGFCLSVAQTSVVWVWFSVQFRAEGLGFLV